MDLWARNHKLNESRLTSRSSLSLKWLATQVCGGLYQHTFCFQTPNRVFFPHNLCFLILHCFSRRPSTSWHRQYYYKAWTSNFLYPSGQPHFLWNRSHSTSNSSMQGLSLLNCYSGTGAPCKSHFFLAKNVEGYSANDIVKALSRKLAVMFNGGFTILDKKIFIYFLGI